MKKYMLFFFIICYSFLSYSMQTEVLLLESAERVYRRNAQEIEISCVDFLNYLQKKDPLLTVPENMKRILSAMGQAEITTEEKKEALNNLTKLKLEIKNKHKREKEKEEEDRKILAQFGWVAIDGRDRKKIRRIN